MLLFFAMIEHWARERRELPRDRRKQRHNLFLLGFASLCAFEQDHQYCTNEWKNVDMCATSNMYSFVSVHSSLCEWMKRNVFFISFSPSHRRVWYLPLILQQYSHKDCAHVLRLVHVSNNPYLVLLDYRWNTHSPATLHINHVIQNETNPLPTEWCEHK